MLRAVASLAWHALLFIPLIRDTVSQVVTSNLTFCDTACQAAQRSGLVAYYASLGGEIVVCRGYQEGFCV